MKVDRVKVSIHIIIFHLKKVSSTEFEGAKITFVKFNMAAETMQLMSEGKDFQMGAVLEIEKDGKKTETELLRKQTDGKVEFTSFESKEMNLKIDLENLAAGVIDIAFSTLDGSEDSKYYNSNRK